MEKIECPVCGYESPTGTAKCPVCKVDLTKGADNKADKMDSEGQSWSVVLLDAGNDKLSVIKKVREITGLELKEAKYMTDNPPKVIISGISKTDAFLLEMELTLLGANAVARHKAPICSSPDKVDASTKIVPSVDEEKEQQHRIEEKSAEIGKGQPSGCLLFFLSFLGVCYVFSEIGISESTWLVLLVTVIVFIVVLVVINNNRQKQLDDLRENIEKEQTKKRSIMEQVFEQASADGFNVTAKVTDPLNRFCIATDDRTKRFLVKRAPGSEYRIYKYAELIDFELSQDGVSTISSRAGDALVGGVLLGTTGAVIGASKSKDIQEYCSSLCVELTINNSSEFRVQIPFISHKISKSTSEYAYAVERAKEMIALLQLIKNSNETSRQNHIPAANRIKAGIDESAIEAIKRYKKLLDMGIITQEEFEMKRKELLKI